MTSVASLLDSPSPRNPSLEYADSGFVLVQRLEVPHGRDAKQFQLHGRQFMVLMVLRDSSSYVVASRLYQWNGETQQLDEEQLLPTNGAMDAEVVSIDGDKQLLLANHRSGISQLYSWSNQSWVKTSEISTPKVHDLAWHFEDGLYFLGVSRFGDS